MDYLPTYQAMQAFNKARTTETTDELWLCEHNPVYTQGLAGKPEHILNPGDIPVIQTNRGGQVTYHGPGQVVAYPLLDLKRRGYFVKEYVYRIEEAVIRTLMHFGVTGHRVAGAPGIYVRLDDPRSHSCLPSPPPTPKGRGSDYPVGQESAQQTRLNARTSALPPLACAQAPALSHLHCAQAPVVSPLPLGEGGGEGNPFQGLGKIAALGIKVSRNCCYHGVAFNVAMDLEPYSRINPCGYAGLQTVDLSTIDVFVAWQEAANILSQKLTTYLVP